MDYVINLLKEKLEIEEMMLESYPQWIAQAKKESNDYGVEVYSKAYSESKIMATELKKAISILRKHNI